MRDNVKHYIFAHRQPSRAASSIALRFHLAPQIDPVQEPDQRVPPPLDLPRQRYVLLLFCQQDSQINVDRGWLEDTCKECHCAAILQIAVRA